MSIYSLASILAVGVALFLGIALGGSSVMAEATAGDYLQAVSTAISVILTILGTLMVERLSSGRKERTALKRFNKAYDSLYAALNVVCEEYPKPDEVNNISTGLEILGRVYEAMMECRLATDAFEPTDFPMWDRCRAVKSVVDGWMEKFSAASLSLIRNAEYDHIFVIHRTDVIMLAMDARLCLVSKTAPSLKPWETRLG